MLTSLKLVRGLRNEDGQYNCFLNVIIQALWHLRSFRQRLLQLQAPATAAAGAANGPSGPPGALSADIQVLWALRAVFQDLSKAATASLPAAADTPAAAVAAEQSQGQGKAGSGSRSSASSSGGSEWLVCPAVLREALARLDLGAAAISIELSEMHDASEVLNEVFTALHHAEAGRAAAVADDPQLPTKVKVRPELFSKKGPQQQPQQQQQQPQQQAQTLAHKLQQQQQANGAGSAAGMNGVASGAKAAGGASGVLHKAPKSLVHALFGLDVLQAIAPGDGSSSKKAAASSAAAGAASGAKDPAGALVEAQQFMQFFHLVPAQVGLCGSVWTGLWCFASTAGSVGRATASCGVVQF